MKNITQYLFVVIAAWSTAIGAEESKFEPLREVQESAIPYPTVADAAAALRERPDVNVTMRQGWMIIVEGNGTTIWSFVPASHPAYPSAGKRTLTMLGPGTWSVSTSLKCEATKDACDKLAQEYSELDGKMQQRLDQDHGAQQSAPRDDPASQARP